MTKDKKYRAPRRPVLAFRVHQNIYNDVRRTAEANCLTMSEEAERRLGHQVSLLIGGAPSSCPCECCYPSPAYEQWFE